MRHLLGEGRDEIPTWTPLPSGSAEIASLASHFRFRRYRLGHRPDQWGQLTVPRSAAIVTDPDAS